MSACAAASACVTAAAQQQAPWQSEEALLPDGVSLDLKRAFWDCDYAAASVSVQVLDAMACSIVYESLKRTAFGGDFDAFLAWWRQHKDAEHARRDAANPPVAGW